MVVVGRAGDAGRAVDPGGGGGVQGRFAPGRRCDAGRRRRAGGGAAGAGRAGCRGKRRVPLDGNARAGSGHCAGRTGDRGVSGACSGCGFGRSGNGRAGAGAGSGSRFTACGGAGRRAGRRGGYGLGARPDDDAGRQGDNGRCGPRSHAVVHQRRSVRKSGNRGVSRRVRARDAAGGAVVRAARRGCGAAADAARGRRSARSGGAR